MTGKTEQVNERSLAGLGQAFSSCRDDFRLMLFFSIQVPQKLSALCVALAEAEVSFSFSYHIHSLYLKRLI